MNLVNPNDIFEGPRTLFYADVMDQEDFIMQSIISDLRASLVREKEIETELPDGSSITVDAEDVPDNSEEQVFDNFETLALESAIDIDEKVLESLITNGEILTDIDLALESFKYSGLGLDDLTYSAIQRTYNRIAGDLRLPSIEVALGSVDGDRTLMVLATEAAVSKRARDVLKKIVDTIISLFRKIKDWYIRVFDQAAREKRRAEKVIKASGSITGAPTDMTVTMKSVDQIGIKGKPIPAVKYLGMVININKLTGKLTKDVAKEYNQLINELSTLTRTQVEQTLTAHEKRDDETLSTSRNDVSIPKINVQNDDRLMVKFIENFRKMIEMLGLDNVPPEDDNRFTAPNTVYHLSEIFPGNTQMSSAYPEKLEDVPPDLGKIKNSFGIGVVENRQQDQPKQRSTSEVAFDTLAITDIKRLAEECVLICDAITLYKQNYVERERRTDQFLRTLQQMSRNNDELDATARQSITSIVGGATSINKNMMNGEGRWVKYVMDIVVHTLNWCTESLAQYDYGKMN